MQCLEVSGAVRPIYGSLGVKRLIYDFIFSLTPFGWFTCIYFILFFYGNAIFGLHYFDLCPIFREHTRASNKPFTYFSSKYTDFVICLGTKILNLPKNHDIDIPFSVIYFPYILFLFVVTTYPAIL